ncbi:PREDICTED: protein MIZU-KUSSEI 1-like [Ipomoea nil]|uniref:protein MIZU-KUSSEI 1-like n=1 Tax=Ipomoea nil TaxID=35883 RepID=UPI0009015037|nr:PREDICTED: protein MIZU-KUSSEI 1-like [Ipomoea nil]
MKTIMARNPGDSFSFSRRYFHSKIKKLEEEEDDDREEILEWKLPEELDLAAPPPRRKTAVSKLRSALTFGIKSPLGARVVGTLFGFRRGRVHFAFQEDPRLGPAFLVELAMPTGVLVREMASGPVRIALECEGNTNTWEKNKKKKKAKLLEEPAWRTYCNGRKCGFAARRECGPDDWRVLNSIGPITMGAGVLPGKEDDGIGPDGELMYMRAKYERVVGSRDSEAFYMMSPDGHGGPELSIYLLRA